MKLILSLIILTSVLSAETCYKLGLGNAALTTEKLCTPVDSLTPPTPLKCNSPATQLPTLGTIKCDLPTINPTPITVAKCTPIPIECPKLPTPVIPTGGKCDPNPSNPHNQSPVPEPASYALLGAGLATAGIVRRFRKRA